MKHGLSYHPVYPLWKNILRRCNNPNDKSYKDYGARGIKMCDLWADNALYFIRWAMCNGYKKDLEIDRVDSLRDYEPGNCRFVNRQTNVNNKRLIQGNNTSGYRGVSRKKYRDGSIRWVSIVFTKGKNKTLGTFRDAELAALVRDEYIDKYGLRLQVNSALKRGNI